MGELQKRTLEWLGNSRVLGTGLPRLDSLTFTPCRSGLPRRTPQILVATANTSWFTADQQKLFLREFSRLAESLGGAPSRANVPEFKILWRVAATVAEELGVTNDLSGNAAEALMLCDALITTPSSLAVEAMILGIPTLIFDPYACPILTPTAWHATSVDSVMELIPSLLASDERRAGFQDSLLRCIAPTDRGSASRICRVIKSVVAGEGIPPESDESLSTKIPLLVEPASAYIPDGEINHLRAMSASIPMLDRIIAEKQQTIDSLYRERERPTLRHALGCLYRWVKQT
jgi:hypothetical protein